MIDEINNVPNSLKFAYEINYGFIIIGIFNCLIAILMYSYRVS